MWVRFLPRGHTLADIFPRVMLNSKMSQANQTNKTTTQTYRPLADLLRPNDLAGFIGQDKLVGEQGILRRLLAEDRLPSMILWGPPGSGKTTLAKILSQEIKADFVALSAVAVGLAGLRQVLARAETNRQQGQNTILFLDEIHRWNKAQQDALLPYVENGLIILIGATTENPSFEINSALLSRCQVFVFEALADQDLSVLLDRALDYYVKQDRAFTLSQSARELLLRYSAGDGRAILNWLELAAPLAKQEPLPQLDETKISQIIKYGRLPYDRSGDQHYQMISALHKSLRGSHPDASLYWLARMLESGEDPLYVARRLVRFASEDVGLANSLALNQAVAGFQACQQLGLPECKVILAQVVVYLAKCRKSNDIYRAYEQAAADARISAGEAVPLHLRNAPTKLLAELGFGRDYQYSPDFNYQEHQEYFPEYLRQRRYLS